MVANFAPTAARTPDGMRAMKSERRISFLKMNGCGNDFILIDNRDGAIDAQRGSVLARSLCRRAVSVGADGLILIENDPEVEFRWRFFNADGSEAEMCGNGARCAARFASLTGIAPGPQLRFRTRAGIIHAELVSATRVKVLLSGISKIEPVIAVDADERRFVLDVIHTGVPHAVVFLDNIDELRHLDVERWGRALRYHSYFEPHGTNVNFACIDGSAHLLIRTYERGVEQETLACGTGATAAALAAALGHGLTSPVAVTTAGGAELVIHFQRHGKSFAHVCLEGDATVVYEGQLWNETL